MSKKIVSYVYKWCVVGQYYPLHFSDMESSLKYPDFSDTGKPGKAGTCAKYVFTLNNYTDAELARIERFPETVRFVAYSKEVGDSGTPHLQGYIVYWNSVRMTTVKQFLRRAHIEPMHGTLAQSEQYCSKQSALIKFGDEPAQGRRTDIITVKRKLDEGMSVMDVMQDESCFNLCQRNERSLSKYASHIQMVKRRKLGRVLPEVHIRVGPSRTGKTSYVYERHGFENVYLVFDNTGNWYQGYNGEPVVLFDDVRNSNILPFPKFLNITDGWPTRVSIKNGDVVWQPKYIYFTSNQQPADWWPTASRVDFDAVLNRIWTITTVYKQKDPETTYKNKFHYGIQEEASDPSVQEEAHDEEAQAQPAQADSVGS